MEQGYRVVSDHDGIKEWREELLYGGSSGRIPYGGRLRTWSGSCKSAQDGCGLRRGSTTQSSDCYTLGGRHTTFNILDPLPAWAELGIIRAARETIP